MKRPWGWHWTLYSATNFKIKLLYFKSNSSCSMQRHSKRIEIWCFLFGCGRFTLDRDNLISKNGSCWMVGYGEWHKYDAISPTLVLEIQTGLCREDDIERRE